MQKTRKNYEDIYPAGPTYIRGVRAGETLYISGVTALNSEAKKVRRGVEGQHNIVYWQEEASHRPILCSTRDDGNGTKSRQA